MTIKTLFDPDTGRILGAQIVGFDGVDKRIDVLAAAIRAGLTGAGALTELELAYAPPYSSAKDPVNMAGFMIENVDEGHREAVLPGGRWRTLPRDGSVHAPGRPHGRRVRRAATSRASVNIPLDELRDAPGRAGPVQAGLRQLPQRPAQLHSLPHPDWARLRLLATSPAAGVSTSL